MKREYVELLKQLVSCAPVSGDIDAVNQASMCLEEFLVAHGVRVVREDINGRHTLYASSLPEGKVTRLLFNAHLDVVPLTTPDQKCAVEEGTVIKGRGVGDCLGHAVMMAQLICENPGYSCGAIFSTDEEIGGITTAEMLRRGYVATDGIVILDSWAENKIASGEKGMLNVKITAHGKSGHAAYPWKSVNALDLLMAGYAKLRAAWPNPASDEIWADTLSATGISCNSMVHNIIPSEASIFCNIRYITPGGVEQILERIRQASGLEDVQLMNDCCSPVVTDESLPFMQKVLAIASEENGHPCSFCKMHAATDARHVVDVCPGVPVLLDGICHGNIHAAGEWMDMTDVDRAVRLYTRIIRELGLVD